MQIHRDWRNGQEKLEAAILRPKKVDLDKDVDESEPDNHEEDFDVY